MRLKRPEKSAENIPSEDEITAVLIRDNQNPGPRYQNEPAPPAEPPVKPSEGIDVSTENPAGAAADNEAVQQALQEQAAADAAKADLLNPDLALKRQYEQLQQAQQFRQQHAQQLQAPQTRQQWVAALMQQSGTTKAEGEFLLDHPVIMYEPKAMQKIMAELHAAGVQRDDSPEYFRAVEETFQRHLERKQQKAAAKAAAKPPPEFFTPTAPPPEQPEQSASSIYSAPVSRQAGGGNYQPSPSSIRLSREEQEAARMAGISDTEYARNKLKMLRMQQTGQIQK
jgi:hypothetical protein